MSGESETERGDVPAEAGEGSDSGRYSWWDWSREVADLPPPARRVVQVIGRRLETPDAGEGIDAGLLEGTDASLEEVWRGVSTLHRSLDRCRQAAPPGEFREVCSGLHEAAGELWAAGIEAEVGSMRAFLSEIAHDLRSPLHSSLFLTDSVLREEGQSLSSVQRRKLSVVHSAVAALLRLSNDLLEFTGTDDEDGWDDLVEIPFSTSRVVDDLEALLEPIMYHRQARLVSEVADSSTRVGDPQVLQRVLLNLVTNALEAVDEGGTVRLRVGGDEDRLRAVIENDSGDADPERLRELLDSGDYSSVVRRLGAQTRGLGLVISGRMIRASDASVEVERIEDGGTRMSVTFPFPVLEEDA